MAFISRKFGLQLPAERGKVIISKGYHTKCSSRRDVVLFMSENERNSVHFVRGAYQLYLGELGVYLLHLVLL